MAQEPSDPQGQVDDEADLCGTVLLGRYKILERLGKGGMGTVYLGEHTTIGKKFAIKVLSSQYAHRRDLVQRFLQEARAASMINQPNVVEISDFGDTPDGSVFFVMEYLDGEDLGAALKREGKMAWEQVRHMIVQVCRALEAAHAEGIIHRDMKPDNCFRITRGKDPDFIKVLDFGIAKVQSGEGGGTGLTQTGMIFGTPEYMAPEQAEGATVDHRVDVYAVGVIMYELLSGRVPFTGKNFMSILTKHMFEVPDAPSAVAPEAEIPPEAEAIVLKAMQKSPDLRFAGMAEMIEAIEAVGTGAGAVEVVKESIVRPEKGPTTFSNRGEGPRTAPELSPGERPAASDRKSLLTNLGIGAGVVAVAAVVLAMVFGGSKEPAEAKAAAPTVEQPKADPEPAVVAAPRPSEPKPAPPPSGPVQVELHFSTNVPAQILDARDQAIYGSTDAAEGIEFDQSDQPIALILRAEGYEPLAIEVVPNKAKNYEYELIKVEERRNPSERRPRSGQGAEQPVTAPEPESKPDDAKKPKTVSEGDLKNPFGR